MRRLLVLLVFAIMGSSCAASPEFVVTAADPEVEQAPDRTPTGTGPDAQPATDAPAGVDDPGSLLLTADDVPGWQHSGPMDFGAEPTFEAEDCELMNQAWAANTYPGTRTRATTEGATLRNTVVQLEDEPTAAAVLDAADRVWEECVELAVNGGIWWAEPIEVPAAGWRSSGLVLGHDDGFTWAIAYWQHDNTILLLEVDGERTFDYIQPLFAAVAGRLAGKPTPVPPAEVPGTAPTTTTDPEPRPSVDPDEDAPVSPVDDPPVIAPEEPGGWTDHPLAEYVPEPREIGADWIINSTNVTEYAASEENEELAACGLTEPPTLEGIEVTYNAPGDYENTVQFVVNRGAGADVQEYLEMFRAIVNCGSEVMGFYDVVVEITAETITDEVAGAEDAVVTRIAGQADELHIDVALVVVSYGDLLLAMSTGDFSGDGSANQLSPDEMVDIIERAAGRT